MPARRAAAAEPGSLCEPGRAPSRPGRLRRTDTKPPDASAASADCPAKRPDGCAVLEPRLCRSRGPDVDVLVEQRSQPHARPRCGPVGVRVGGARLRGVQRHDIHVLDQLHGQLAPVELDAVAAGRDRKHVAVVQLARNRVPRRHALAHLRARRSTGRGLVAEQKLAPAAPGARRPRRRALPASCAPASSVAQNHLLRPARRAETWERRRRRARVARRRRAPARARRPSSAAAGGARAPAAGAGSPAAPRARSPAARTWRARARARPPARRAPRAGTLGSAAAAGPAPRAARRAPAAPAARAPGCSGAPAGPAARGAASRGARPGGRARRRAAARTLGRAGRVSRRAAQAVRALCGGGGECAALRPRPARAGRGAPAWGCAGTRDGRWRSRRTRRPPSAACARPGSGAAAARPRAAPRSRRPPCLRARGAVAAAPRSSFRQARCPTPGLLRTCTAASPHAGAPPLGAATPLLLTKRDTAPAADTSGSTGARAPGSTMPGSGLAAVGLLLSAPPMPGGTPGTPSSSPPPPRSASAGAPPPGPSWPVAPRPSRTRCTGAGCARVTGWRC